MTGPKRADADIYWAAIPEYVLFADVSAIAVRLFGVLNRFANDPRRAGIETTRKLLAEAIGNVSLSTLDRSMGELRQLGAVTVEAQRDPRNPKVAAANLYRVNMAGKGPHPLDPLISIQADGSNHTTKDDPQPIHGGLPTGGGTPMDRGIPTRGLPTGGGTPMGAGVIDKSQRTDTGQRKDSSSDAPPAPGRESDASQPASTAAETAAERQARLEGSLTEDITRLCRLLADLLVEHGATEHRVRRAETSVRWRSACRLLLTDDGKTPEQVETAIRWCQSNEFWRANILSMPKLRGQYDALRLRALEERRRLAQTRDSNGNVTPLRRPVARNGQPGASGDEYRAAAAALREQAARPAHSAAVDGTARGQITT